MEALCDYCVYIFVPPQNVPLFLYIFATQKFRIVKLYGKYTAITDNILSTQLLYF